MKDFVLKAKSAIKRIAAISAGAVMVGATIMGAAMAGDLANYPSPFIENGQWVGLIVVGSDAASGDIIGATDIAAALAQEAVTVAPAVDGVPTVSEGVLVEAPGNDLNYDEDIGDVEVTGFDDGDLPVELAEGTYNDNKGETRNKVDYDQIVEFTDATATIVFDADDNDPNEPAGTYLFLDESVILTTFTVEFDESVEYDGTDADSIADDWEMTRLELAGKIYTISDVDWDGIGEIDKMTLLGGALEATQGEYTTATYTLNGVEYVVEVVIVSDDALTVKLKINGETTDAMGEGDTYELADGTEVGVQEVLPNEGSEAAGADIVTFYLGAQKITLEDGQEVKINDETLDDYEAIATFGLPVAGELDEIEITVQPEDDTWIGMSGEWVDPVFGSWKLVFTGLEKNTEDFKATASGDDGELSLMNIDDDQLDIPLIHSDTSDNVYPGDDLTGAAAGEPWVVSDGVGADDTEGGNLLLADDDYCADEDTTTNADLDAACDGIFLLAVNSGGEARLLEITDVDSANDEITIKDRTTDSVWDNKDYSGGYITMGGFMELDIDEETGNYDGDGDGADIRLRFGDTGAGTRGLNQFVGTGDAVTADFRTSLSGEVEIDFAAGGTEVQIEIFEDDGNGIVTFDFDGDGAPGDMIIDTIAAPATLLDSEEDSDIQMNDDDTGWGAIVTWDSDNKDDLTVEYPEEQVVADVYFAPTGAVVTAAVGEGAGVVVSPIAGVPVAKLDTEVTDKTAYNMIIVGDAAVNRLAAELAGITYPTYGAGLTAAYGFGPDEATLKVYQNAFGGTNTALLVAGWEAPDTRNAANVLKDHKAYALTGEQMIVKSVAGVLTVSPPTVAPPAPAEGEAEAEAEAEAEVEGE